MGEDCRSFLDSGAKKRDSRSHRVLVKCKNILRDESFGWAEHCRAFQSICARNSSFSSLTFRRRRFVFKNNLFDINYWSFKWKWIEKYSENFRNVGCWWHKYWSFLHVFAPRCGMFIITATVWSPQPFLHCLVEGTNFPPKWMPILFSAHQLLIQWKSSALVRRRWAMTLFKFCEWKWPSPKNRPLRILRTI